MKRTRRRSRPLSTVKEIYPKDSKELIEQIEALEKLELDYSVIVYRGTELILGLKTVKVRKHMIIVRSGDED